MSHDTLFSKSPVLGPVPGPAGAPVGSGSPRRPPRARSRAGPCGAAAGLRGGKEPTREDVEPRFSLVPFHKSLSLVSFSSPTGSGEIELIMFQILEKSELTGAPFTFPRSGIRRGCLDREECAFFLGGRGRE